MDQEQPKTGRRVEKQKGSALYWIIMLVLLGVFAFSVFKIAQYYRQMHNSKAEQSKIAEEYVDPVTEPDPVVERDPEKKNEHTTEPEQIRVDFTRLQADHPDVVGYIYSANTALRADTGSISFPIVQCSNNDFYLNHGVDGKYNINGAIFMDYRSQKDYSDQNTVVYGHRMWSGHMFASLLQYKTQSYYEAHPHIYIYTPAQNYRMDLLAGCNVESVEAVYQSKLSRETVEDLMRRSAFRSAVTELPEDAHYLTLSTCDKNANFRDPRFIILGLLVPID